MNTYQSLQQKVLGLAFILGPLLLTMGAVIYLLGIERSPDGTTSWVEGIFMAFGMLMMVPSYFELARILGQRAPLFGILCTITGLGWAVAIVPAVARLIQVDIINAGLNESIWNVIGKHPGWVPLFIAIGLGMFTSLFLGSGLLWRGGVSRWIAVLLILAPIFFFLGQGEGENIAWWRVNIFYPLACLTWLAALAPIGVRYLAGESQAGYAWPSALS
jgi:hypothetical protein